MQGVAAVRAVVVVAAVLPWAVPPPPVLAQDGEAGAALRALDRDVRALHERSAPAVLRVAAERAVPLRLREPTAEALHRAAAEWVRTARETVTATGFLLDSGDLVVTVAAAVDRRCEVIRVTFPGGETRDAALVGSDPLTGVALLRIRPVPGVRALSLAPRGPAVGAVCFLVGYPDDDAPSLEMGFVSATGRAAGLYDAYVVADVVFRAGDAGAPLLDGEGRVAGLAVAPRPDAPAGRSPLVFPVPTLRAEGDDAPREDFRPSPARCIPAPELRRVVDALRERGRVPRGLCGVYLHEREPLVTEVAEGMPAAAAGVRSGDRVLAVDGTPVESRRQFVCFVQRRPPGATVSLLLRAADGTERTAPVVLGEFPDDTPLPPAWFDGLGVADGEGGGVEVHSVLLSSSASAADVRVGDRILSLAGREVRSVADYEAIATSDLSAARELSIVVLRDGERVTLVLK